MAFKKGYTPWNKSLTKETDERIKKIARKVSKTLKGKPKSKEAVRKVSKTKKRLYREGKLKPWNKGLTKEIDERVRQNGKSLSEAKKKLYREGKIKSWNKGIPRREETKRKSSEKLKQLHKEGKIKSFFKRGQRFSPKTEFKKGHIPWSKGLTKETDERIKKIAEKIGGENSSSKRSEVRRKIREHHKIKRGFKPSMLGKHHSKETRKKMSENTKNLWKDPNFQKKMSKSLNIKPTKPEKFLINFIKQHNLSFKYTGDYSVWIEGKNPDFIECNGKKLIIEFNGFYKHNKQEEIERAKIFSGLGFRTLFLHYPDLKDEGKLLNKISEFCGGN